MDIVEARNILRYLVDDTRMQIEAYAMQNGVILDVTSIEDQELVRSIIKAVNFKNPELEEIIMSEILKILNL